MFIIKKFALPEPVKILKKSVDFLYFLGWV